ncbi:kinesin-like protein KIF20B [Kryptolebias marmoratus]|uniref:kinesin-like protein KIF20B n=1 Tax=Kryptolebias marmoratus TaxID=37003 RepID=UPI0018ACEC88|nr:kinesin-like protein KIF20B [Kryptolebias marmoratus]
MMESCLTGKPERVDPVEVEDIKKNLLDEFAALPAQDSVQSLTENLQVYLRIRPFTAGESDSRESQDCVTIEGPNTVVLKPPRTCQSNRAGEKSLPQMVQRFTFTQVFGPEASQRKVFQGSVRGLVRDVLQGGNSLVFTYGVTNAGKTFTFLVCLSDCPAVSLSVCLSVCLSGPDHDSGLLPRSLSVIFNSIEGRLYGRSDLKPQRCRDFSRLTPDQQVAEVSMKKNLLRLLKESNKTLTAGKSAFLEGSSLSSDSSLNSVAEADSFCLDISSNVCFSVWVSFCEIYNDNIHDLLEQVPSGQHKRTVLRLSQDVKGNSFIKDLRWVEVNSSEEAYRVMKIGKKNQSCFSTRLNQLSSRSHSIFSIRILRIDDVGVPRVLGISELVLCDLAGSERCSRTHNTGVRLKEAGNINSSLLTLGKCINAMRLNQNAKFQHHVPFRESKLTHFLQFFFCGAGRVSMVVNVNQNSSCFDETLNVLKFSALAQKVVVMNSQPVVLDDGPHRSAMELSIIVDEAEQHRNGMGRGRKSSLVAWETSLEDVQEDGEEEEEEEEEEMDETVLETGAEEEEDRTMEEEEPVSLHQQSFVPSAVSDQNQSDLLFNQSGREAALRLVLEAQIREEVSAEFMDLFNKMEKDYSERLEKEREILEERAERRVEILKNLISQTVDLSAISTNRNQEEPTAALEGIISSMTEDLKKIKEDAQTVHHCLTEQTHEELETLRLEKQQSHDQLQEALKNLELQQQNVSDLTQVLQQKDDVISKLQEAVLNATTGGEPTCSCRRRTGGEQEKEGSRKRQRDAAEEEMGGAAKRKVLLEEEIWRLQEETDKKEETIKELRRRLEEELRRREEEVEQLKKENMLLEKNMQTLTDLEKCPNCDSVLSSLEVEQKETARLQKENKALVNGIFQLEKEATTLQAELKQQTDRNDSLSEQLNLSKSRLLDLKNQLEEKRNSIENLTKEVDHLKQEVKEEEEQSYNSSSVFHAAMEELKKESQEALQRSAQKSKQMEELQREKRQLEETLAHSQNKCEELTNQRTEFTQQLQSLRAELESEGGALRCRLEEMERAEEERRREVSELSRVVSEKEELLEESRELAETLRRDLQRLEENLHRSEEKENRGVKERRGRRQQRTEEDTYLQGDTQEVCVSPLRSNKAKRKKIPQTLSRKRKSSEVEGLVFSENKKNRGNTRNNKQDQEDRALQKIEELVQSSPSVLSSKAKTVPRLVKEGSMKETKPRRGRKKLFKMDASSPLLDSPHATSGGAEDDKESDHLIIRRQLRSKTCRK